jgi:hypothetical protein
MKVELIYKYKRLNMLYKVSPFGYFSRVAKVSRGPWFQEHNVEDDGLEWFYVYSNDGEVQSLLSNNVPLEDRERLSNLYKAFYRNRALAWAGGLWLGFETVTRVARFSKMAIGWKALSLLGFATFYKNVFQYMNGQTYGPVMSAFFRKYSQQAKADKFDITDRKREYFEIDTSDYMSYNYNDLGHDYHVHHGPQPDGETMDSSWLSELDKFLKGQDNKLKEHKNFVNYNYEYLDKSFPTPDAAKELMHAPLKPEHVPYF